MDTAPGGGAWLLLFTGVACMALGLACRYLDAGYPALVRALGGPPAGPRETRWVPWTLLFAGVAWLVVGWAELYPFAHGARPYAIVILSVVLPPLGALALAGAFMWIVLLRRFG
ncbi:MAG: hypothetical protein AAB152_06770 [Candidatus Coatesbacteria bacterium]